MARRELLLVGALAGGVALVCGAIIMWPAASAAPAQSNTAPPAQIEAVAAKAYDGNKPSDWDVQQRLAVETLIAAEVRAAVSIAQASSSSSKMGTEYCGTFHTQGAEGVRSFLVWIFPDDESHVAVPATQECEPPFHWIANGKILSPNESELVKEAYYAAQPEGEPWYAPGHSPINEASRQAAAEAKLDRTVKEMLAMEEIQRRTARGEAIRSSDIDWR